MPTTPAAPIPIVLLAAGRSTRMRGRDKLLEMVHGLPLLRLLALRALAATPKVIVVLPDLADARDAALSGVPVRIVRVAGRSAPMADSMGAGVAAVPQRASGAAVALADMPEVTTDDFSSLLRRHADRPGLVLRGATADGRPGHPVVFPASFFEALTRLQGDHGARELLASHPDCVELVPLPGRHAITDLDTPEDWAAWREAHPM